MFAKEQVETVRTDRSTNWYECKIDQNGEGWDCSQEGSEKAFVGSADIKDVAELDEMQQLASKSYEVEENEQIAQQELPVQPSSDSASDVNGMQQSFYTLQIGAFPGEAKREEFVADKGLEELPLSFYQSVRDGRIWWVLTYGEFADIDDAKQAFSRLKQDYAIGDAWIRSIAGLSPDTSQPEVDTGSPAIDEYESELSKSKPKKLQESQELKEAEEPQSPSVAPEDFYDPYYSIQLAAFKTEKQRIQFVEEKGLSGLDLSYVEEGRLGLTWWIVLYGKFDSVADAKIQQEQLESEFGLGDTWIRPNQ